MSNESAARSARTGPHFDQMVGCGENLHIMIDEDDGIAVGDQILHHGQKSLDIARVQADGGFVQHVENAGGAVAHGTRKLHTLPFAC